MVCYAVHFINAGGTAGIFQNIRPGIQFVFRDFFAHGRRKKRYKNFIFSVIAQRLNKVTKTHERKFHESPSERKFLSVQVRRRDFIFSAIAQRQNKVTKTHERKFHESPFERKFLSIQVCRRDFIFSAIAQRL